MYLHAHTYIHMGVPHIHTLYVYIAHVCTVYTHYIRFACTLHACVCMHMHMYAHKSVYRRTRTDTPLDTDPRTAACGQRASPGPSTGGGGGRCRGVPLPRRPPRRCRTGSRCSSAPDVTLRCPAGRRGPGLNPGAAEAALRGESEESPRGPGLCRDPPPSGRRRPGGGPAHLGVGRTGRRGCSRGCNRKARSRLRRGCHSGR